MGEEGGTSINRLAEETEQADLTLLCGLGNAGGCGAAGFSTQ